VSARASETVVPCFFETMFIPVVTLLLASKIDMILLFKEIQNREMLELAIMLQMMLFCLAKATIQRKAAGSHGLLQLVGGHVPQFPLPNSLLLLPLKM
jgi:hypothetical protein